MYYPMIALAAYAIGGIPFGLMIGRLNGIDIRTKGSGNIGATNVTRVLGKQWGIPCFILDFLKGFGPAAGAIWLAGRAGLNPSLAAILGAAGAVCGHIFCPYLKFRGGKGIATSAGAIIALAPLPVVIAFTVWLIVLAIWRYVSLASIAAAVALPLSAVILSRYRIPGHRLDTPALLMLAALGALAVARHRSNLKRILAGTESKIGGTRNHAETHENHSSQ